MDFFGRQADARRLSRRLVLVFALAVTAVILAVNGVVLTLVANLGRPGDGPVVPGPVLPDLAWIAANPGPAFWTTLVVAGFIGGASLYRTVRLRAGGGDVALSLGGRQVLPGSDDPLRQRLLNVVEEMAIAAGVPVPEVYVLEQEAGINAFAAGLNPADAAIAVTRGALEQLDRDELQGVIAHEFSHILNGDMALNTRLIGLLFGLVAVSLAARIVLYHAQGVGRRWRRGAGGALILMAAAAVILAIGSVGVFFGRLIQAAVSRHRERLADASAVQFTRATVGLRDALVKIGASQAGSRIVQPEAAEIAHLLFAPARARGLAGPGHLGFATHPPLVERIRALDPAFDPAEFGRVRQALDRQARHPPQAGPDPAAVGRDSAAARLGSLVDPGLLLVAADLPGRVAQPQPVHVDFARLLAQALPASLAAASVSPAGAGHLLFALCLDGREPVRSRQLAYLDRQLDGAEGAAIRTLLPEAGQLHPAQRLPTLLRLLPALRRQPRETRQRQLAVLHALLQREGGQLSLHAYALRKLAHTELRDELRPAPVPGRLALTTLRGEAALLLAILAGAGHDGDSVQEAYQRGMGHLVTNVPPRSVPENWPARLDQALNRLDRLSPPDKARLVQALGITVSWDRRLTVAEVELLRAICGVLHCPLPPLEAMGRS